MPVRTVADVSLPATIKSEELDCISPMVKPLPSSLCLIIGEMKSGLLAPSSMRRVTFSMLAAK